MNPKWKLGVLFLPLALAPIWLARERKAERRGARASEFIPTGAMRGSLTLS